MGRVRGWERAGDIEIRALGAAEFAALGQEAAEIFGEALAIGAFDPRRLAFPAMARRHAEQPDFRAFGALAGGRLVGFSEGYGSVPGLWWHDLVSERLPEADRRRWLEGSFELVELHVHPEHQGLGIGGRLHDLLLERLPHRTAVLSTRRADTPAMALYLRRGWVVVADDVRFPGNPTAFRILGRDLP